MTDPAHYQHSGRFSLPHLVIGIPLASAACLAVAWLYAYGIFYIPFIYLNVILTALFAAAIGFVSVHLLRGAKVRHSGVFTLSAAVIAAIAYYGHWAAWVGLIVRRSGGDVMGLDVALQPGALWRTVRDVNEVGAWSIFGIDFAGGLLWGVWGLEAVIIFAGGILIGLGMFDDLPFCEKCGSWCKKHSNVARVWGEDPNAVVESFRARDLDSIRALQRVPLSAETGNWLECDVEVCPKCGTTNTLDVSVVQASKDEKGEEKKETTPVISNLLITGEDAEAIRSLGSAPA